MKQTNPEQIKRAEEMLEQLKELRGGSLKGFHYRFANDPALLNAFIQDYISCNKTELSIPRKYRELFIMALGCSRGAETTAMTHGQLAYENGATIEEIGEVLRLVMFVCGVTAILPAAKLFDELEVDVT